MVLFTCIGMAFCVIMGVSLAYAFIYNFIKWVADTNTLHARLDCVNERINEMKKKQGKK
jgi:hypothetical protein